MLNTVVIEPPTTQPQRALKFKPTLDEARALASQGNVLPVYCELPADLETPVSVYLKLRGMGGPSFLLESVEGGEQIARYSFLGIAPAHQLIADAQGVRLTNGQSEVLDADGDPLTAVKQVMERTRMISLPGLPRFFGGAVGYMSYDLVRYFERLPATAIDDRDLPLCHFLFTDTMVAFDHVKHRLLVIANAYLDRIEGDDPIAAAYADAVQRIEVIVDRLRKPKPSSIVEPTGTTYPFNSNTTRERYESMVETAKEYIAAGDIFQVVLSQRFERETDAEPFAIYRALRMLNPSPYMVFLDLGETKVIASSPEMMTRTEDGVAEVRPIAGTRRRGATEAEDAQLAADLLADPKERAEHVMLVDLGRNDLGRVCRYGSVHVPDLMFIERFSHVIHITSRVLGKLSEGRDAFDLIRATFPAGTLSGAPKVRAMEIIEELEGVRRGPYGGAIGYFGYTGALDSCITIRTIIMRGRKAYFQAGAGIVADSVPSHEYEECGNKARALSVAINMAEEGF